VTTIFCNYVAGLHTGGVLEVRNVVLRSEQHAVESLEVCASREGFSPTSV
jgi:hypothetical protein